MRVKVLLVIILVISCSTISFSANNNVFSTWDSLGADACASAWLIKNFVNKDAKFMFYPKGELIEEGIAFDTPDSNLRRKANMSAYEIILMEYKIEDIRAGIIGKLIHEIEINAWLGNLPHDAEILNRDIKEVLKQEITPKEKFSKVFSIMDNFYEDIEVINN